MKLKSREIGDFLDCELLPKVREVLAEIANENREKLEREFAKAKEAASELGVDPQLVPKITELKRRLSGTKSRAEVESEVYGHLVNFFARYYNDGDFMSLRRYSSIGRSSYLIPYDGEEVKLHWANADQYYIKSTENYASYVFTAGDDTNVFHVRFEIAKANDEKDAIKLQDDKQRRFILASRQALTLDNDDLVVKFEHRPLVEKEKEKWPGIGSNQQSRINKSIEDLVLDEINRLVPIRRTYLTALAPTERDPNRTLLAKHIERYTTKNSFDYFIHKDLNGFLTRELDIYLKQEVLNLDDLERGDSERLERVLAQMRAIRHVAEKVITFLAQLENFQKKLWLKKKIVLDTQWCVTLDLVPDELYTEIVENSAQCEEWARLFDIDEISGNPVNKDARLDRMPISINTLQSNQSLVLDTRHFDTNFTNRLLEAISQTGSLESQTNGLLIHGENFAALNLLQEQYKGQVHCVHIDPPYNTNTSGFLYKNGYRHSSWLAMMSLRVEYSNTLLASKGNFICHIDENEYERLYLLLNNQMGLNLETIVWDKRNPMTGGGGIARQHEYIIWHSKSTDAINFHRKNTKLILEKAQSLIKQRGYSEETQREFSSWVRKNKQLSNGEKAYSFIDKNGRVYQSVSLRAPEPRDDPKFHKPLIHPVTNRPCPVPPNGFSRTPDLLKSMIEKGEILFGLDETIQPRQKMLLGTSQQLTSMLTCAKRGKAELDGLGVGEFPYAHSTSIYEDLLGAATKNSHGVVLDYFAGSGTTGHAVISLNREDGGNRKYVLVEMGHHFDSVMLPRLKKVVYSPDWKKGQPQSRDMGVSQLIKYIRLESYEDTLDGLVVTPKEGSLFNESNKGLLEDYQLRYALSEETNDSACLVGSNFTDPFSFKLSVVRDGVRREVAADLPETFNYLLGLQVNSRFCHDGVLVISGVNPSGQIILVLWRKLEEMDSAALEKWFSENRNYFPKSIDFVYVNGDNTLNAIRHTNEKWIMKTIEPLFRKLMFDTDRQ